MRSLRPVVAAVGSCNGAVEAEDQETQSALAPKRGILLLEESSSHLPSFFSCDRLFLTHCVAISFDSTSFVRMLFAVQL